MRGPLRYLAIFLLITFSAAKFPLQLEVGDTLSAKNHDTEFLTSPDKTFSFGFYQVGNNAYLLAIWFTNSQEKTVIWTANRDRPVNGRGSEASLKRNGAIVLSDVDGTVVWEVNSNFTTLHVVSKVHLLDSGNLVITSTQGKRLWQSFDYPTDTLLPYQTLTKSKRLLSQLRKGSYESGYYILNFDSSNVLTLFYDGPEISSVYWPDPSVNVYQSGRTNYNSTRIAALDQFGSFQSSDLLYCNASDMGYGIQRRLTLDYDGNLRIYSLNNLTGLWDITWQAVQEPCTIRGLCGRYGLCVYTTELKCSCPPGFVVSDPSDWSKGCKRNFNLNESTPVKFLELPHTDYFGFDLAYSQTIGLASCKNTCQGDNHCEAFGYRIGTGQCFPKNALFNGYRSPDVVGTIYLKVPASLPTSKLQIPSPNTPNVICDPRKSVVMGSPIIFETSKTVKWVYLYSFCSALGAIEVILFALGWCLLFRKNGIPSAVELGYERIANQFRRFSYTELKKATKNFKEELGRGGSGSVYKGVLPDGTEVAIKRLAEDTGQAEQEFQAEISTIGKINHMNLVRMWGYCSERKHRLLVYEYVKNSSLDKHLFGSKFLNWKERFAVALGSAKALAYLHDECLEWIIHCDVKPENILLDNEFQPKISDFGLAKLSQRGGGGSLYTRIRGTKGYMAPEWATNQPITAKIDVYGYGVVILEMVKGRRMSSWVAEESELKQVARIVKESIQEEEGDNFWVKDMVDPRLEGNFSKKEAEGLVQIGVSCIGEDINRRPTMSMVVHALIECQG